MNIIELEFGSETLRLRIPPHTDILTLPATLPLANPAAAIRHSLQQPLGSPALADLVRSKVRQRKAARAVIVVSDNTRPVPYCGAQGVLEPLLDILHAGQVPSIEILVATGTHRPLSSAELRQLLPPAAFMAGVQVTNHCCTDLAELRHLGCTARGTAVWVNRRYLDADIKILTGLVEPHFMAGVSGGAKAVCPGLVGEQVTQVFHGAALMADARSDSLYLEHNPCREESRAVAGLAGVDFILNVTLDRHKQLTGVFAGDLDAAHRAATEKVLQDTAIPIRKTYPAVITHAGFVGINHYQAAKAAVEASRALLPGGTLVLAANLTDSDPVGGANYKRILPMLRKMGPDAFEQLVLSPQWTFVPEQWQLQMWGRVFRRLGPGGQFVFCAPQLTGAAFQGSAAPGLDGGAGLTGAGRELAEAMVQRCIDQLAGCESLAILADGPYGVPRLERQ